MILGSFWHEEERAASGPLSLLLGPRRLRLDVGAAPPTRNRSDQEQNEGDDENPAHCLNQ